MSATSAPYVSKVALAAQGAPSSEHTTVPGPDGRVVRAPQPGVPAQAASQARRPMTDWLSRVPGTLRPGMQKNWRGTAVQRTGP